MNSQPTYRPLVPQDRPWLMQLLNEQWGGAMIVSKGRCHDAGALPGIVAEVDGLPAGVALYHVAESECEIVLLQSLLERQGIGTTLLHQVRDVAATAGCRRVWLITTNDNCHASRFYQHRGMRLAAVYRDAVVAARVLKPTIPLVGADGIPICDEVEFEMGCW